MNLAKHESEGTKVPDPIFLCTAKTEKKLLSLQELIAKAKAFTIEVYGDDAHHVTVEEILSYHRYHGAHIQLSFQLADKGQILTDPANEVRYERKQKQLILDPRTGIVESMRNVEQHKNYSA